MTVYCSDVILGYFVHQNEYKEYLKQEFTEKEFEENDEIRSENTIKLNKHDFNIFAQLIHTTLKDCILLNILSSDLVKLIFSYYCRDHILLYNKMMNKSSCLDNLISLYDGTSPRFHCGWAVNKKGILWDDSDTEENDDDDKKKIQKWQIPHDADEERPFIFGITITAIYVDSSEKDLSSMTTKELEFAHLVLEKKMKIIEEHCPKLYNLLYAKDSEPKIYFVNNDCHCCG